MELRDSKVIHSGRAWNMRDQSDIVVGDYIRVTTTTFSQLWMLREDNPNRTLVGKVISIDPILVRSVSGETVEAFVDIGSSGYHTLERLE